MKKEGSINYDRAPISIGNINGTCKTYILPGGRRVFLAGVISPTFEDVLSVARLVLSGSDLEPGDPRLAFIQEVRATRIGPGWNPGGERITFEEAPRAPVKPAELDVEDPP